MRKFIFAIVLLLAVLYVIVQFSEVEAILDTFRRGDWRYLLLAVCLECLWLFNVAISYRYIFQITGIQEKMGKMLLLGAAANFANVVAPTAGMSGMAVFISEARRRGYSTGRATIGGVLFVLFDYAGFLFILAFGLLVLIRRNNLNFAEIIATIILLATASIFSFLLYLGTRSGQRLGDFLAKGTRFVNKLFKPFTHRQYLSEERAYEFAYEASDALKALEHKPMNLVIPFFLAVSSKILLMGILLLLFIAFEVPLAPGTLVAGFSLGYLFFIVSPTPAGIGFVEGGLTLALSSLSVPLGQAAVIALSYRGITFWLPLAFGAYAFRFLANPKVESAL
jgi:glycosyltransferase 2 family protein